MSREMLGQIPNSFRDLLWRVPDRLWQLRRLGESSTPGHASPAGDSRVATTALLLEVAHADDDFTEGERRQVEATVQGQFGLGRLEAARLVERAERVRAAAADVWQLSHAITGIYSCAQKSLLADIMRSLAFADGALCSRERYVMSQIWNALRMNRGRCAS